MAKEPLLVCLRQWYNLQENLLPSKEFVSEKVLVVPSYTAVQPLDNTYVDSAMDGISHSALREIKLLQELKHPNIIAVWKLCFV